jgi:hypothetical protein
MPIPIDLADAIQPETLAPRIREQMEELAAQHGLEPAAYAEQFATSVFADMPPAIKEHVEAIREHIRVAFEAHVQAAFQEHVEFARMRAETGSTHTMGRAENAPQEQAASLAELFAGRTGVVDSGGRFNYSRDTGKAFADLIAEKRADGRL